MIYSSGKVNEARQTKFEFVENPQRRNLSTSRFKSPSLKLGKVNSWRFIYQSPSRVEHYSGVQPLTFNRQAHKIVVRKLPKFHQEIAEDDPLKQSKIIENINHLREQHRRKNCDNELNETQPTSIQRSMIHNNEFQVSRVLVNVKGQPNLIFLRQSRSVSCSNRFEDRSGFSFVQNMRRSGNKLNSPFQSAFQSMCKQDIELLSYSKINKEKKETNFGSLVESRYVNPMFGKQEQQFQLI